MQWKPTPARRFLRNHTCNNDIHRGEAATMKVSESDTVIITTDGRARLNVEKLLDKQHVKDSLKQMREKIRHAPPEANASQAQYQPIDQR
ncbi:MAG: hypothetical protein ACKV2U_26080 [Bryobacteraceae bacterium]